MVPVLESMVRPAGSPTAENAVGPLSVVIAKDSGVPHVPAELPVVITGAPMV